MLWLGDPSVLPLAGWSVAPGLEAATSMNGLPGGSTLFSPPDSGTSDVIMEAIRDGARPVIRCDSVSSSPRRASPRSSS